MRHMLIGMVGILLVASLAVAGPPEHSVGVDCNWGLLTMEQILKNDFNQGGHSADPSGDGHGPGTNDEPRAGLANVLGQGDLEALCEFIQGELEAEASEPVTQLLSATAKLECNWGQLTMTAILEKDFDQGPHSSDPSGDGHGPGDADAPRAGLANVLDQGNLQALCIFIESML